MVEGDKENKANGPGKRATLVLGEILVCVCVCLRFCVRAHVFYLHFPCEKRSEREMHPVSFISNIDRSFFFGVFSSPASFQVSHTRHVQDETDPGVRGVGGGEARDGHAAGLAETVFDGGEKAVVERATTK